MSNLEKIMKYYKSGKYTKAHIRVFVKAGKISKEEYTLITGEQY